MRQRKSFYEDLKKSSLLQTELTKQLIRPPPVPIWTTPGLGCSNIVIYREGSAPAMGQINLWQQKDVFSIHNITISDDLETVRPIYHQDITPPSSALNQALMNKKKKMQCIIIIAPKCATYTNFLAKLASKSITQVRYPIYVCTEEFITNCISANRLLEPWAYLHTGIYSGYEKSLHPSPLLLGSVPIQSTFEDPDHVCDINGYGVVGSANRSTDDRHQHQHSTHNLKRAATSMNERAHPGTHLPVTHSIHGSSNHMEVDNPPNIKKAKKGARSRAGIKLACQNTMQVNHNAHLTDELEQILSNCESSVHVKENQFRVRAYKTLVTRLKNLDKPINTVEEFDAYLPDTLGKAKNGSLRTTIAEILLHGTSTKALLQQSNPKVDAVNALTKIWGVGPRIAHKLIEVGIYNIEDCRQAIATGNKYQFSVNQRIGVEHYEDFQLKIPRDEVQRVEHYVKNILHTIIPDAQIQAVGSYRRGRKECGDVDLLIAPPPMHPGGKIECLERLIRALASEEAIQGLYKGHPKQGDDVSHIQGGSGFLTAILSLGYGEEKEKGRATFMGVYRERQSTTGVDNPRYRRIDIKVWPVAEYCFAILHFTGSGHFNRSMRFMAHFLQWKDPRTDEAWPSHSLSEHGLQPVIRKNRNGTSGEVMAKFGGDTNLNPYDCKTEADIFKVLKMQYVRPEHREVFVNEGSEGGGVTVPSSMQDALSNLPDLDLSGCLDSEEVLRLQEEQDLQYAIALSVTAARQQEEEYLANIHQDDKESAKDTEV